MDYILGLNRYVFSTEMNSNDRILRMSITREKAVFILQIVWKEPKYTKRGRVHLEGRHSQKVVIV